ncbi:MAG: FG-GAP-like repeat-containing protein [Candidatus Polarisedimenticolia bacterium]
MRWAAATAAALLAALAVGGGPGTSLHAGAPAAGILAPGADLEEVIRANNRGAALMEQFKHREAMQVYATVTAKAPGWAPGFVNRGLAAFYARVMGPAEEAFREAARLDPDLVAAHYGLAVLLKNDGKSAGALAALERARALDPEDADILYNMGVLHARERRFEPAIGALERARQIDPNAMSIRYQLARALLQAGRREAGEKEMAAYQKLAADSRFAVPTGNQYGEAGRHALVLTDYSRLGGPPAAAPPIAVRFSDATAASGIAFVHAGPGGEASPSGGRSGGRSAPESDGARRARFGSGVAIADLDGDGRFDLVFANADAAGKARPALYRNKGGFAFEDITARSGVSWTGIGTSAAAADYDDDGDADLWLGGDGGGALYRNRGDGTFKEGSAEAGIAAAGFLLGVSWVDMDHDGDADLFANRMPGPGAAGTAPLLFLNLGNGAFREDSGRVRFAAPGGTVASVFADLDGDRDIDAFVTGAGTEDVVLDNRREEGLRPRGAAAGIPARRAGWGRGAAAGDLDGDGLPDLVVGAAPPETLRVLINGRTGRFTPREVPGLAGASIYGIVPFDADNDGDLDLFTAGDALRLHLNDGAGRFRDVTADAGLRSIPAKDCRGAAAADLDGDGDLDLVVSRNGAAPILLRNEGGHRNRWLEVRPRGLHSNPDGIGTKVDVQAGAFWQRQEVSGGGGYLSQSPPILHFGLGDRGMADFVRLLWPGGVLQSELDVPAGQRLEPNELDRKGSSCPVLFAWNGGKYVFITDFLGVGGLGMWMAPGVYGAPDPDEYVKIEPRQLAPQDGAYLLQVVENLEESTYLDEADLVVLDHPADLEVYPDERFGGKGPPAPRLFAIERDGRRFPRRATDHNGRDVLDTLLKIDRTYPDDFRLLRFQGYAEMHHVTLEFPEAVRTMARPVLFLYGWVDFEYASSNYAAHQAGIALTPPILEMEDEEGQFVPLLDPMGFPGGMPRMMTVDLAPLAPLRTARIRLRTNMRVYWDQAFVAEPLEEAGLADRVRRATVEPSGAHLHRRGYPREHSPDGRLPKIYDYGIIDNTQPFKVMTGDYTRFGRVTDLVKRTDDMFVIFGRGEELTLEFPVKGLPEVRKGWTRSFLLYTSGYTKDMDPYTAHGDTVEPLPFRAMTRYPYGPEETYPDGPEHREYRRTWNTRRVEPR